MVRTAHPTFNPFVFNIKMTEKQTSSPRTVHASTVKAFHRKGREGTQRKTPSEFTSRPFASFAVIAFYALFVGPISNCILKSFQKPL
jgi:hypothetical protein